MRRLILLLLVAIMVLPPGLGLVQNAEAAATFTVNSTGDDADASMGDGQCRTAAGQCTLRAAIQEANALGGLDHILFNLSGAGPFTITPSSPLPEVVSPITFNGYSQPGASPNTNGPGLGSNAVLKIELSGASAGSGANGLVISAGGSTVSGLAINRFSGYGVVLRTNGANTVAGSFIGTNATGTSVLANGLSGIQVLGSSGNAIGWTDPGGRNVLSGNRDGVFISGAGANNNVVQGNIIGLDRTGMASLGNTVGVLVQAGSNNVIGGTAAASRNTISGNTSAGVVLWSANGNLIQGNFIGTDVGGAADLGNKEDGVVITGGASNTVGGTVAGARNTISGNDTQGVRITGSGSTGNLVQGNYIGVTAAGNASLANGRAGVFIDGSASNTVGGVTAGARNVVSGNGAACNCAGIELYGAAATGNLVQGNYVGTDASGASALGNAGPGVFVNGAGANTIGGAVAGARNVISGNLLSGVEIFAQAPSMPTLAPTQNADLSLGPSPADGQALTASSGQAGSAGPAAPALSAEPLTAANPSGSLVQGNLIGTDATGSLRLGNGGSGVRIYNAAQNLIGGSAAGSGNVISGNGNHGIYIYGAAASGNAIEGNYIGPAVGGVAALGNAVDGVYLYGATNTTIGGAATGARNVISGNVRGIEVGGGATGTTIQGNYIGVTAPGDAPMGNLGVSSYGVILFTSTGTLLGGAQAGMGNVISANGSGVYLAGDAASATVQGNLIGTDKSGSLNLGNQGAGIGAWGSGAMIGGAASGAGNTVAFNTGIGILVGGAARNAARANSIFSNGGMGIDLGTNGANSNDPQDADTGPNNLQNAPVLLSAVIKGNGELAMDYFVDSGPAASAYPITVDFFNADSPAGGEGRKFLGSASFTAQDFADGPRTAILGQSLSLGIANGDAIVATATDAAGNTSEFSVPIVVGPTPLQSTNLFLTQTADKATPNEQDTVVLTITVWNSGPSAASGLVVLDRLPQGLAYVSHTPGQGTYDPAAGRWAVGSLASGASAALTLTAKPAAGTGGRRITNTAWIDSAGQVDSTMVSSNAASASMVVLLPGAAADLEPVLTASTATPREGALVTYTLSIRNKGPNAATGVRLKDVLPPWMNYTGRTVFSGATYDPATGVITLATAPVSAYFSSTLLLLNAGVAPGADGKTIINTLEVTGADQPDPVAANNTASVNLTVQGTPSADLRLSKSDAPDPVRAGNDLTYTITATNNGPSAANGVMLTDTPPAGVTVLSASTSGGLPCSSVNTSILCPLGPLDSGASATVTVVARPSQTGSITNTAAVAGIEPDPTAADNQASQKTDVVLDLDWQQLPVDGAQVTAIAPSPSFSSDSTIYIGTGNGVYRSTNGGQTWTALNSGLADRNVQSLALSPAYPADGILFAGAGRGLFRSADRGATWAPVSFGLPSATVTSMVVSPNFAVDRTVFVVAAGSVYQSVDGGATWRRVLTLVGVAVAVSPAYAADGTVFAATQGGVYRSTDRGATWSAVGAGVLTGQFLSVAVSPSFATDRTAFAGRSSGLFKSTDGGATWIQLTTQYAGRILISPAYVTDRTLFADLTRSTDGGQTWSNIFTQGITDPSLRSLALSSSFGGDGVLFAGTAGSFFRSANRGDSWTELRLGLSGPSIRRIAVSPNFSLDGTVLAAVEGVGMMRSPDGGRSWAKSSQGMASLSFNSIAFSPAFSTDRTVFARAFDGLFRSTDGGVSWTQLAGGLPTGYGPGDVTVSPNFQSDQTVFVAFGDVYRSTDRGNTWTNQSPAYGATSIAISPAVATDGLVLASTSTMPGNGIFRSTDRGLTWAVANLGLGTSFVNSLAMSPDFVADRTVFALASGSLYRSTNGGVTWMRVLNGTTPLSIAFSLDFKNDGTVVVATGAGLLLSLDRGSSWTPFSQGLTNRAAQAVAMGPDRAFVGTAGGLFQMTGGRCGDLNEDGGLTVLDMIMLLKIASSSLQPTALQASLADLDRNGVVNVLDAVKGLQAIVGLTQITDCGAVPSSQPLRAQLSAEPSTLDPNLAVFTQDITIVKSLFSGLMGFNKDLTLKPVGVEAIPTVQNSGISADGKVYTFNLRKNATWSDGRAVTAQDYAYSIRRMLDPKLAAAYASFYFNIVGAAEYNASAQADAATQAQLRAAVGVSVLDDYTLKVNLKAVEPVFLQKMALWPVFPLRQDIIEKHGDGWTNPGNLVGNGPFVLKERVAASRLVLERNPNYGGASPSLQSIQFIVIFDEAAALAAYRSGLIDLVSSSSPATDLADPALSKDMLRFNELVTFALQFNVTRAPFNAPFTGVKVRQALALAIDRDALIAQVRGGLGKPALGWLPPGLPGFDPNAGSQYALNVTKAKQLLAEAGYPNGFGAALTFSNSAGNLALAQFLQTQWSKAGVALTLVAQDPAVYRQTIEQNQHQIALMGWGADYPDPENFLAIFTTGAGNNHTLYSNTAFDSLIAQAGSELDPAKRLALLAQAHALLLNDAPIVPLFYRERLWLKSARVLNLQVTPMDGAVPGDFFLSDVIITQ